MTKVFTFLIIWVFSWTATAQTTYGSEKLFALNPPLQTYQALADATREVDALELSKLMLMSGSELYQWMDQFQKSQGTELHQKTKLVLWMSNFIYVDDDKSDVLCDWNDIRNQSDLIPYLSRGVQYAALYHADDMGLVGIFKYLSAMEICKPSTPL